MYLLYILMLLRVLSDGLVMDTRPFRPNATKLKDAIYQSSKYPALDESITGKLPRIETLASKKASHYMTIRKIKEYVEYVKEESKPAFQNIGSKLKERFRNKNRINKKVDMVTEDYATQLDSYFKHITDQESGFFLDLNFILLNVLDTSCKLLYRQQVKMVQDIVASTVMKNTTITAKTTEVNNSINLKEAGVENITNIIQLETLKTKQNMIKHLCTKYNLCKPYPSFTDYSIKFLNELLRLPDVKLNVLIESFISHVKENKDFRNLLSEVTGSNDVIMKEIERFCRPMKIKEAVSLMRNMFSQRFKILHSENMEYKHRVQATRVFLDIIDDEFHYIYEDNFLYFFDSTLKAIHNWAKGKTHLPEMAIGEFVNNLFSTLNFSQRSLKGALMEMIIRGHSVHEELDETQFMEGSKGVYEFLT